MTYRLKGQEIEEVNLPTHLTGGHSFFDDEYGTLKSPSLLRVYAAVFLLTQPPPQKAEDQPYPDPIHGHISLPIWLVEVLREKKIRRMLFIRQLGLKAYIDFPGAIHTQYSHALGTMQLAGKVADLLVRKERIAGNENIARTLEQNHTNLMSTRFVSSNDIEIEDWGEYCDIST